MIKLKDESTWWFIKQTLCSQSLLIQIIRFWAHSFFTKMERISKCRKASARFDDYQTQNCIFCRTSNQKTVLYLVSGSNDFSKVSKFMLLLYNLIESILMIIGVARRRGGFTNSQDFSCTGVLLLSITVVLKRYSFSERKFGCFAGQSCRSVLVVCFLVPF